MGIWSEISSWRFNWEVHEQEDVALVAEGYISSSNPCPGDMREQKEVL